MYYNNNSLIYLDPTGLSTTLDDYAYQLRTQATAEEKKNIEYMNSITKYEYQAAANNQGFTEFRDLARIVKYYDYNEKLSSQVFDVLYKYPYFSTMNLLSQYVNFNVTVKIIRPDDGTGNSFNSKRYVFFDDGYNSDIVYWDIVGANCRDIYASKPGYFTLPDGEYYCKEHASQHYKNTYALQTKDSNLINLWNSINYGGFLFHANQFAGALDVYNGGKTPGSGGCIIGQNGQSQQNLFMSYLSIAKSPESIRVFIKSLSSR